MARLLTPVFALLLVFALGLGGRGVAAQSVPPDGTGRIISGSIPAGGGFGLIVYGGGTYTQLVTAAGCPQLRVAFWATRDGAFVVFVPGSAVAAVNAEFQTAFPGDQIPANTPFIGRCIPVSDSGIQGRVTLGPICPVQSDLLPCPDRPYVATLVILDSLGRESARVTSGADGQYRVVLAPGRYIILPLSPPGQTLPRASAVEVQVQAGQFLTVDIAYDTGIRSAQ